MRPRHPNCGDVLFRYGKFIHMQEMLEHGRIRIGPASFYRDLEDRARADEECKKSYFMPGECARITTIKNGKELKIIGDLQYTVSGPNYYVLCMSCDWDLDLFKAFPDTDTCVVIHDTKSFEERLKKSAQSQLGDWYFLGAPVQYFDPYEKPPKQFFDNAMSKSFEFAYQREFRSIWMHMGGKEASGFKYLDLGDLRDIAQLHRDPRFAQ